VSFQPRDCPIAVDNQASAKLINAPASNRDNEIWWKTYVKGVALSLPALAILAFSSVFLLPKLETLWRDTSFGSSFSMASSAITAVQVAHFVTQHLLIIIVAVTAVVALLEWRSRRWPKYRRASVSIVAFVANTAVLVFITTMFMTTLMTAPALLRLK
jgi:hypothetical protein